MSTLRRPLCDLLLTNGQNTYEIRRPPPSFLSSPRSRNRRSSLEMATTPFGFCIWKSASHLILQFLAPFVLRTETLGAAAGAEWGPPESRRKRKRGAYLTAAIRRAAPMMMRSPANQRRRLRRDGQSVGEAKSSKEFPETVFL
ncbi:hypothetical protein NL676_013699 [Syzygium grande]|nr:hypothetical protein NL676_013699 [Syzygium grande]